MKGRDLLKLFFGLALVGLVVFGIYQWTETSGRKDKYSHPIARPGASW